MSNSTDDTGGWPELIPLDGGKPPRFPVEALPDAGREMVEHIAKTVQVDPAMPGGVLLGLYSLAIQGRVAVQAGAQIEVSSLQNCIVAGVSERKSTAIRKMLKPVKDYEQSERKLMLPIVKEAEAKRAILKARIDKLTAQASNKADDIERAQDAEEVRRLQVQLGETPASYLPRLWTDDTTEERLGELAAENGGRMAIISPEPTVFKALDGTMNKTPLREIIIKGYSGDHYVVDRQSRKVSIDEIFISVVCMAQPGAVRRLIAVKENEERGTLSRFLFFPCQSLAGDRLWSETDTDPDILCRYDSHILDIFRGEFMAMLPLSRDAKKIYVDHYNRVEQMLAPGGELHGDGWGGKEPGRALRIAAGFHCAEKDNSGSVSADVMRRAVRMSEYDIEAYLYIRNTAGDTDDMIKLRTLLDWIVKQRTPCITARHAYRALHIPAEEGKKRLNQLADWGHVKKYVKDGLETYMVRRTYLEMTKTVTD